MGTILTRTNKQGATRYTAIIRIKKAGKVVHSESETFGRKAHASEWMRRRESELDSSRARGEPFGKHYTLSELIKWYREEIGKTAEWGRSKEADLKRLETYEIAKRPASSLTVADYLQHAYARVEEGAGPATIGNDLIWIGQVLRSARPSLGVPANLEVLSDARHELRARKMLAKSRHRDRRLEEQEHKTLVEHFTHRDARAVIPMLDIYLFALTTARREEEITRIKWADLDKKKGIAWLDDVKHPRQKKGNRRSFRLLPEAWKIIDRQSRSAESEHVFPYNHKSISAAFTRACKVLGIRNLRFHDLRHECTSRLFERGYAIQEVAQFTLHTSWATLKRYTHLKPEDVKAR